MDYVVSDPHFWHFNSIGFDNRPFETVEEMNQTLIDNWNAVVESDDTVYVLGDMFYRVNADKAESILKELNGNIIYIFGNHEKLLKSDKRLVDTYFESTHDYLELDYKYKGKNHKIVLCHYPIPTFNGHYRNNSTLFYGHVHNAKEQCLSVYSQLLNFTSSNEPNTHRMLNVGVMMDYMNYTPQSIPYLLEKAEERSNQLYNYYNQHNNLDFNEFVKLKHLYLQ